MTEAIDPTLLRSIRPWQIANRHRIYFNFNDRNLTGYIEPAQNEMGWIIKYPGETTHQAIQTWIEHNWNSNPSFDVMWAKVGGAAPVAKAEEPKVDPLIGKIRVVWIGRPYGHAQWPERVITVDTEAEAIEHVKAKIPKPFNEVYAQRYNHEVPSVWNDGTKGRWNMIARRKARQEIKYPSASKKSR